LPDAVPPQVVNERRERIRELERTLADNYGRSLFGRRLDVLVEGADPRWPGHVRGTSCRGVPVSFPGHLPALLRRRAPVRAAQMVDGLLIGEPEPERLTLSLLQHS
jgi:tRNA A37 methylthiotransferase MiaB